MGRSSSINATTTATAAPSSGGTTVNMKSPIPYLFGGLGLMLALIAVALLILACSYRKYSNRATQDLDEEAQEKPVKPVMLLHPEMEPKINVVIMAGDEKPRYLAMPVSSLSHAHQELEAS